MTARIPPNFPEGERALLGGCLLNNAIIAECCALLTKDDFYREAHRNLFSAMSTLATRDAPVDWVTLTTELKRQGTLETCGGPAFLAELSDAVPSAANWRHYAEKVKESSKLRAIAHEASGIVDSCYVPEANTEEITANLQDLAYRSTRATQAKKLTDAGVILREHIKTRQQGSQVGFSTGLPSLDEITGGLYPKTLTAILARPSVGKTAFALGLALHLAKTRVCAFFSMEMSEAQVSDRILSAMTGINSRKIRRNQLSRWEWEKIDAAQAKVDMMTLYVDDTAGQSIPQMRAKCKELAISAGGLDVVFYDHLRLGKPDDPKANETHQMGQLSRDFRALAKEVGFAAVLLVQLNRSLESRPLVNGGRKPRLVDMRGSGEIEENVDVAIGLYRPEVYVSEMTRQADIDEAKSGKAQAIVLKNRDEDIGTAYLLWDGPTTTFRSPAREQSYVGEM